MKAAECRGVIIVGPTASGKTRLGMGLAGRFSGEIISCDALQVYRFMDIGTGKATAGERERIPHHMLDLRDPGEDFSAGEYQRLARVSLAEICRMGRIPLVVGGTGFYLRALVDGLFEGPGRAEKIRARLSCIAEKRGVKWIYHALRRIDPETAARIAPADSPRLIRAYEVYLATGRSMSWWQSRPRNVLRGYTWLKLGIATPRPLLTERINRRVQEMFESGFVEEVQGLLKRFSRECQAFKAIGYREIAAHLEGRMSLQQALEETRQQSRRYAKRQMTWFRLDPEIVWLDGALDPDVIEGEAAKKVAVFLGSGGT
jgi:tRNA dimethylallyltransferase